MRAFGIRNAVAREAVDGLLFEQNTVYRVEINGDEHCWRLPEIVPTIQ